jgi:hypothetical protein
MLDPMLEMQLWVQSDNPDYQKAVAERLEELRANGEAAKLEPIVSERERLGREWREAERIRLAEEKRAEKKRRKAERVELKELEAAGEAEEAKELRSKLRARRKYRAKKRENARAFAVKLGCCEDREQFKKDLFDGLVSLVPQEKAEVVLCAEPPKEVGHLSDSEVWNGYEWERD